MARSRLGAVLCLGFSITGGCRAQEDEPSCTRSDFDCDGFTPETGDCNDADPTVHPGAIERSDDGLDSNCDGYDEVDSDGDGVPDSTDCDDADPGVGEPRRDSPDGLDNDCDGCVDEPSAWGWGPAGSGTANARWEFTISLDGGTPSRLGIVVLKAGQPIWTGEACQDGVTNCHPFDGSLELLIVYDTVEVVLGATTATRIHDEPTWAWWDENGNCFANGYNPEWYEALGCCPYTSVPP